MPNTYTLISSNVLSSSAASVTFSAIPSTYTDLVIRASVRNSGDNGNNSAAMSTTFNGDTATNYSWTYLYGATSTATSGQTSAYNNIQGYFISNGSSSTASTFANTEIYIPSYAGSNKKLVSYFGSPETNATALDHNSVGAALWQGTAAITTILLKPVYGANFVSGSSFYLYGIKNS
jgi:hypothetical protein